MQLCRLGVSQRDMLDWPLIDDFSIDGPIRARQLATLGVLDVVVLSCIPMSLQKQMQRVSTLVSWHQSSLRVPRMRMRHPGKF